MKDDITLAHEAASGTSKAAQCIARIDAVLALQPSGRNAEEFVSDLLADLMHWCDAQPGVSFADALMSAERDHDAETDDEPENTWRQTACRLCGHDVEGDTADEDGEWRDRGNNPTCPDGKRHLPVPD